MMLQAHPPYYKLSESTLRRASTKPSHSSVGSNSTPHAPRIKKALVLPSASQEPHQPPQGDVTSTPSTSCVLVQPFRRTHRKFPPPGVPLLDLSKFNEPDEQMKPIKVTMITATERSILSWGSVPGDTRLEQLTSDLCVEDVVDETTPPHTPAYSPPVAMELNNSCSLEPCQSKFMEDKVLSNERPCEGVVPREPAIRAAIPRSSLAKKLRFEARVLTQNGRDVHRELCGFFFLFDGSLTVYEFRQFGKKSSALPIIGRSVYKHLYGPSVGQPYEINWIQKGATLSFTSNEHPALPDTLSKQPVLSLIITFVDEVDKKQLLTEGRNPVEIGQVEKYLSHHINDDEDKELYRTLQGMVVSRLHGHSSKTLVGLGRELLSNGDTISKQQLQQSLRNYHISLTVEDMDTLWLCIVSNQRHQSSALLSNHHHGDVTLSSVHPSNHCHGDVRVDGLVSVLVGPIPEDRQALIRKVFRKLDPLKTGSLDIKILHRYFRGQRSDENWSSLYECLQPIGRTSHLTYADFEHYYHGLSLETPSDVVFSSLLRNCWSV
ncbi:calcyphosin-2-like [Halichondria panicea]|uniref:calcyphosin-2-like n=1 Tax=Halichondria panicea TaxID=6063 RepID=UPI00312BA513